MGNKIISFRTIGGIEVIGLVQMDGQDSVILEYARAIVLESDESGKFHGVFRNISVASPNSPLEFYRNNIECNISEIEEGAVTEYRKLVKDAREANTQIILG